MRYTIDKRGAYLQREQRHERQQRGGVAAAAAAARRQVWYKLITITAKAYQVRCTAGRFKFIIMHIRNYANQLLHRAESSARATRARVSVSSPRCAAVFRRYFFFPIH